MNKARAAKLVGQVVRLQPAARRAGVLADDDWLVAAVTDESVKLEHTETKTATLVGLDSIHSYQTDPNRDTSSQKYGFLLLHAQVEIAADGTVSVTPLPPPRAATVVRTSVAESLGGPRMVVEQVRVNTPAKMFGGDEANQIIARQVSYATVTIKNDSSVAGPDGVAKNVTAHVVFSNGLGHYLTVEGDWDKEKQTEPLPKVLDNFFGGGPSVWFNVGQRRSLILAFKIVDDEPAYAVTVQPHVRELEVRAPGLALPKGQFQVVVEVRSHTSNIRENLAFVLRHRGKGTPLELTSVQGEPVVSPLETETARFAEQQYRSLWLGARATIRHLLVAGDSTEQQVFTALAPTGYGDGDRNVLARIASVTQLVQRVQREDTRETRLLGYTGPYTVNPTFRSALEQFVAEDEELRH
jgi:hypothetical protein